MVRVPLGDPWQICEVKTTPQACFPPISSPARGREALHQSQERTCSGNDAELIAFNPDTADNLEARSLRQRSQINARERKRENREDRERWKPERKLRR